ncbi:MAG TPA: hypothetical protein VNM22_19580 [Candidatus Limnocylindrales bacterium]|nr:hypothetical protein [Candidatus Limnocylindrales bacterium]
MTTPSKKFHQAALVYLIGAILVVFLTIFLGGTPERKSGELRSLIPAAIILPILAGLVYKEFRILTKILAVLAGIRTLVFLLNFLGFQIGYDFHAHTVKFSSENLFTFNYLYLVTGLLTGFICYMLARAAWDLS